MAETKPKKEREPPKRKFEPPKIKVDPPKKEHGPPKKSTELHAKHSAAFIKGLFETRASVAAEYGHAFDMPHWYHTMRTAAANANGERYSIFIFEDDEDEEYGARKSLGITRRTQTDKVYL